ncbi:MAG TPA: hypothetical protein VGQ85_02085, partial [Candidatus Limnocylindrales bacterium]|nr:hypothetical protein [Candidatus Limnocylindrales bacterium]
TLDQEIEGSNPSSPANNMLGPSSDPTATSCVGLLPALAVLPEWKIRRIRFERESVVCAPDSSRIVRLTRL